MNFENEYERFLNEHLQRRSGERLRRLEEGHKHAEHSFLKQVWWPLFHHFKHLHPEYEVDDFRDGKRYLDFAYIRPGIRMVFEIDGYGPHLQNISRWQFSDNLDRQNQLVIDGWIVLRFSYDQVKDKPRKCQQIVQQAIGKWLGDDLDCRSLTLTEREVLRLALQKGDAISPIEIQRCLHLSDKTIKNTLTQLVDKKMLIPSSGIKRIRLYQLGNQVNSRLFESNP